MELNRRNFIALLAGGVAGIHITPLPWKLTDDIAIWTQNWPWVPVPPEGPFIHEKSVCTLCPGGCGIEVRKVGKRAVKIEGRTDYPVNPGGICPVGMGGLQLLYDETIRFTGPMKRVGPRGSGEFMPITWSEALQTIAGRIKELRAQGRPDALASVDGNPAGTTPAALIERIQKAVGSPNYVRVPDMEDTHYMANNLMMGTEAPMAYDLENANYILSFGSGLLEGWSSPGRILNAWGLWHEGSAKKKVTIVQVESRASNTASKADRWVAPFPGTDAALALGIAHVIIKDGIYDHDFVENSCSGFNEWHAESGTGHSGFKDMALNSYSPGAVAEITGLKKEEIVSLAREFAAAEAPLAIYGKGKGTLNGSLYEAMAVQALNALVGNINRPGGVMVQEPLPLSPLPKAEVDAIASQGLRKPRLDQAGSKRYPFSRSLINNLSRAILEHEKSPVDTLMVFSANPAHTLPDGRAFKKALEKIPFIVSFSPFKDETANMADLVLPDHTHLEKMTDITWPSGLQYPLYGLSKPVVGPIYDTRNTGQVILDLAKEIGDSVASSFPWKDFEGVLKLRARGLYDSGKGTVIYDPSRPIWEEIHRQGTSTKPGYADFDEMWSTIKSGGLWYSPSKDFKERDKIFKTPTGKFEFYSTQIELAVYAFSLENSKAAALKEMGVSTKGDAVYMPHFEATLGGKPRGDGYDLTMVPYEMINLSSSWLPNPPFLNKTLFDTQLRGEESFAEINPATAAEKNLRQGDRIIIESPVGKVRVRVNLFEGARPGIIYLPLGFGHTGYDEFSKGKGVNPNDIVDARKDPLSGQAVWWTTTVRLKKA